MAAADAAQYARRFCSVGFHLAPYKGRYPQLGPERSCTPDLISMQQLLAGMRDRGAGAAIVEAATPALACGRCVSVTLS